MDAERRIALTRSATDRLDADTHGADRIQRVRWLLDHLQEYLQRWIGWCTFSRDTMSDVLEHDIHMMLILAADIIDEEVALVRYPVLHEKWREFSETLRRIDGKRDKESVVVTITGAFRAVQAELSRCAQGGLHSEG